MTPADTHRRTRDDTRLISTKNDLPPSTRAEVIALLSQHLADCIDLQTMCKQAHWNVKGPSFYQLHLLFDEVSAAVTEYVDLIAERIVQLGGVAEGTARVVAERSAMRDYPLTLSTGEQHVAALSDALAQFGHTARSGIEKVEDLEDAGSVDLLTEVSRGIDKWLWFVEAHQQGGQSAPVTETPPAGAATRGDGARGKGNGASRHAARTAAADAHKGSRGRSK